jgi:hypothetical protein
MAGPAIMTTWICCADPDTHISRSEVTPKCSSQAALKHLFLGKRDLEILARKFRHLRGRS